MAYFRAKEEEGFRGKRQGGSTRPTTAGRVGRVTAEMLGDARAQAERVSADCPSVPELLVWETAPLDGTQRGASNEPGLGG